MSKDPLLQPYRLKHLTLRNRIMTTSHEPAYPEDGMPKARYRAYHVERAKAGIALTMTAGSAAVSHDSPPVFNNVLAYKDEVVPWLKELTDACHEHGTAVMIQLTHLGRRIRPTGCPSSHRPIGAKPHIAPFRRNWKIGTSRESSATTRMPLNA
jgi:2,4-dienoyl-CoA reductase-like NADH-dependent reductase (Old Yellow Enzyme family)